MIVEKNFLNKLKELGLNTYEAKIWTALLSRGVSSAGELSDISNVPRSRSYDVLENLEKKGFIIMKIGKPIKYIALPPKDVLERVKKRIKEEAEREAQMIDNLKNSELMKELNLLHKQGVDVVDPVDLSGSLKSRSHLYNQINSMIRNAEKSIILMTTAKGLNRKKEHFKSVMEKASRRGVKVRIAAPINDESERAAKILSQFAEVRNIDDVKARFCIVDDKEVVFMLMGDDVDAAYDLGIWVNSEFFANALKALFEVAWKGAKAKVKVTK